MGYLDGNGLARLWSKIKNTFASSNHTHGNFNVFTNVPPSSQGTGLTDDNSVVGNFKFLNHISDGKVKSSHQIMGGGGIQIVSEDSGTTMFDGRINIISTGVNIGTFTHDIYNVTIDTGFTETPKLFKLYYTTDGSTVELAAECRPELDAPFDSVISFSVISSITFDGGAVTIDAHTNTGLSFMWEAYI